ncbi:outer membrane protein [Legionella maioricensis]|uniref:Outer membrane beta-barrel protein n=1 Tax=Legionella maioricensis TaxID=2896528 RepID=A0A9X2D0R1_9GAMM|nr:outer membrane beta-barrel protein [Legionella maioricensis]MCL9683985.1 outer membrane beta-barrel protein [Legionella maioricensis]MCL9687970.1 outer membrane beta-barrel protein [Legionella maioricensis]
MKANKVVVGTLGICIYGGVMAGTMGEVPNSWARVITLSAGPAWTDSGDTPTFFLAPEIEKTYNAAQNTSTLFDGEVFLGVQHSLNAVISGQIGLAVAATTSTTINGEIWDDADPQFNNLVYSYKINHAHVAVKGKLLADMGYMAIPYVSGSVGVGFNRAHNFNNTPIIFEALPNPNFASNTETAFSYTVGIGLQKAITPNWQVGAGYEFADWGKSQLGLALGQTLGNGLAQDHVYTNALMFNVTYLA